MKTKIINFVRNSLPIWFAALIVPIGLFNCVVGMFFEPNTWQTTTGIFQLLYAGEIIANRT